MHSSYESDKAAAVVAVAGDLYYHIAAVGCGELCCRTAVADVIACRTAATSAAEEAAGHTAEEVIVAVLD